MMLTTRVKIENMTCPACVSRVTETISGIEGIMGVTVDLATSIATLKHEAPLNFSEISERLESIGYEYAGILPEETTTKRANALSNGPLPLIGLALIVIIILIISPSTMTTGLNLPPSLGYMSLFMVGVLVSMHCIGMCGGIVMSQCLQAKASPIRTSFRYNAGRVVSYTLIGGLAGLLGNAFNVSFTAKGIISLVAGLFMILMGLNLAGYFKRHANLIPRIPSSLRQRFGMDRFGPFTIGLFNGLMPCGPLQAMQLYALGTGDPIQGALSMFFFSLGTVPTMFSLGAFSALIGKRFNKQLMLVSGIIVIILGVVTTQRGLSLIPLISEMKSDLSSITGYVNQANNPDITVATIKDGYQEVTVDVKPRAYGIIRVQKGIPVKFNLRAEEQNINGCNNGVILPAFRVDKVLEPGDNIIEFTPTETGTFEYSCWMNMITSKIEVVEDLNQ